MNILSSRKKLVLSACSLISLTAIIVSVGVFLVAVSPPDVNAILGDLDITSSDGSTISFPSNSISSGMVNFNYAGSASKGGAATSATSATSANGLSCTSCVSSTEVDFNYAGSSSKGGSASGLACTTCVSSTEVDFNYAGSSSKGGAATSATTATTATSANGLACTTCVSSTEVDFNYAGSSSKGGAATSAVSATSATTAGNASACNNDGQCDAIKLAIQNDNVDSYIYFHDPGNVHYSIGVKATDGTLRINYGSYPGEGTGIIFSTGNNVGIGAAPSYKLHVNGNMYAGGSSRAYKTNIGPLEIDSSAIYKLNPVTYDYRTEYEQLGKILSGGRQFGLIAEDVADIIPELTLSDGTRDEANVDYEKLSVLLLAEVKKLRKEADTLKAENSDIQNRLIRLESLLK